ncbi:MAG TPA: hypothetical protein VFT29_14480 [Gemmatimonadaceae bacterium]|nr:hypothetical protein [Gemmatimonadaceae bacterium]
MHANRFTLVLTALAAASLAACASSPTETSRTTPDSNATLLPQAGAPQLLHCPATQTVSTSALVTPLGAVLSIAGTSISIPAGALLSPTTVTVTVPASEYMEVDVTAMGASHFVFELPVVITIDYSRCGPVNLFAAPYSAWYIDSETKALLELMVSVDNKLTRTVTFTTGHLSGYALAN